MSEFLKHYKIKFHPINSSKMPSDAVLLAQLLYLVFKLVLGDFNTVQMIFEIKLNKEISSNQVGSHQTQNCKRNLGIM